MTTSTKTRRASKKAIAPVTPVEGCNDELYGRFLIGREDEMTGIEAWETPLPRPLPRPLPSNRSIGVSRSWQNEATRVARTKRYAVRVDGVDYLSVAKAFAALNIGPKDIIKVRGLLVKYGEQTYQGHDFELIAA